MKKNASFMLVMLAFIFCNQALAQLSPGRTYTLDADFNEGSLLSVNTSTPNQLRLDQPGRPLPYVNFSCSGRGTIQRLDANTGQIIGEYLTCPSGMGANPSRTTVDKFGNIWVSNRDEAGISGGVAKGSLSRIGIVIGGSRCNNDGTANPAGQYLKPPFFYNTCIDRDRDGLIKTSFGQGNILPWTNAGGANTNGGVSTAEDEAIITYTRVSGTNARTVAIDDRNDVWVGGLGNRSHQKISGNTGLPIPGTEFNNGTGGYGGFIDGNGVLWSSGSPSNSGLIRYTPNSTLPSAGTIQTFNGQGNYGLGVDPNTGEVWHSGYSDGRIYKLSPSGALIGSYTHGYNFSQGCAVDAVGNVWVAHSISGVSIGHLKTDGTFIGNIELPQGGSGPTGIAVDANGKLWLSCYTSNQAMRIDPDKGPIVNGVHLGEVDLVVDLGANALPYNYSDMTGYVVINATVPSGTWTTIHDSQIVGTKWGRMNWADSIPEGTGIRVEARASDDLLNLASNPFVQVFKNESFCCEGVTGRYVEIRVTLFRQLSVNNTPALFDLTIESCNVYPNTPPTISSTKGCNGDTLKVAAGQPISFTVTGNDVDLNQTLSLTSNNLPSGSTVTPVTVGNPVKSLFSWTTDISQIGNYHFSFDVNDTFCYSASCPVNIKVVPCPTITATGVGISCYGKCNARASVTISGNPTNFTYKWNTCPIKTTPSISGLCPGSYKVITSDGFACTDSAVVVIPSSPCTGFRTYTQGGWGATPKGKNIANYLKSNFISVFPNGLTIGCNNTLKLTSQTAIDNFLSSSSTARALPVGSLINPGCSYKNVLAGQLVAATLNVKFDSADVNFSSSTIWLGNLIIASGKFSGWKVIDLIKEANRAIGGCGSIYSFSDLSTALELFNKNYHNSESESCCSCSCSCTNNGCYLSCPLSETRGTLRSNDNSNTDIFAIQNNENEIQVFPNPVRENGNIRIKVMNDGLLKIDLLNIYGAIVSEIFNSNNVKQNQIIEKSFSTSRLESGVYLIRFTNGSKISYRKIVVSK